MILTDQTPRFGTHVICGLTVKFNHHRVKVYYLHVFCLASLPIQTILNDSSKRETYALIFTAAAHTRSRSEHTQRERGVRFTQIDSSFTSLWTETYTQSYVKIPILASILVNTVGYVLSEPKQLRKAYKYLQWRALLCYFTINYYISAPEY